MTLDPITEKWIKNPSDEMAVKNGCRFDYDRGHYTVDWIERICKLYEGEWAGHPLILEDDWQLDCTVRMFGWVKPSDFWKREIRRFRQASIWVAKKNKKALSLDTILPTPTGYTTIGEIQAGDTLFDEFGKPCTVLQVHDIDLTPDSYYMEFSNGESVRCNAEHEWETTVLQKAVGVGAGASKPFGGNQYTGPLSDGNTAVRETSEIAETLLLGNGTRNHTLPLLTPIQATAAQLPIDPYVFGCWLGDGDSDCGRLTAARADGLFYAKEFASRGYELSEQAGRKNCARYKITKDGEQQRTTLKDMGVFKNKHIPMVYLRASVSQRIDLLAGLLDTDGCIDKKGKNVTFCSASRVLIDGVGELLSTLGMKWRLRERRMKIKGVDKGPCWWIQFNTFIEDAEVFKLPRKLSRMRSRSVLKMRPRSDTVQIIKCEKIPPTPMRCISVSSESGLFRFGKTMLTTHNSPTIAAWSSYLFAGDGEMGQKVYLGSKDGEQVKKNAAKHVYEMYLQSPELMAACSYNKTTMQLTHEASRSVMFPLSSSNERSMQSKEGLNGSLVIDETHVVDRAFMSRLSRMHISRSEPFHIEASTAGNDPDSYGKERFDYAQSVLAGDIVDEGFFAAVYAAPQDVSDEEIHADPMKYGRMANPAMGHTVNPEEFMADYETSKNSISKFNEFKMYRLNIWQNSVTQWLKRENWNSCRRDFTIDDVAHLPCWAGLDLSKTRDMSSVVLVFREDLDDGPVFYQIPYFWLPENEAKRQDDKASFLQWHADGLLMFTPEDTIEARIIQKFIIEELAENLDIQALIYDQTYAGDLPTIVEEEVFIEGHVFKQNMLSYAGPTADYERLIIEGKLHHNGHKILTWQSGHVQVKTDANNNRRPVKPPLEDHRKIDGIVAGIMALSAAIKAEPQGQFSAGDSIYL